MGRAVPQYPCMAVMPSGEVVFGGAFGSAGGVAVGRIARYNPASNTFSALGAGVTNPFAASVTAVAPGAGTLSHQWRRGGVAINTVANPSAATPMPVLRNVGPSDAASYDCLISSGCGNVTSNAAQLSLMIPPPPPCTADVGVQGGGFGHDGILDSNDFISFINEFFNGC